MDVSKKRRPYTKRRGYLRKEPRTVAGEIIARIKQCSELQGEEIAALIGARDGKAISGFVYGKIRLTQEEADLLAMLYEDKCGEKITLTSPVLGVCHLCYTDFDMARFDAIPPPNKEQQTENDELEVKK